MRKNRLHVIIATGVLLAGALAAVILIRSRPPVPTRPMREYAPVVRVITAEEKQHRVLISAQGTVEPRTESNLVAEVAGRVVETAQNFATGAFFKKGDMLLKIDPRDYELAVVTARGQVAQARVRLETEEAQAKVAREEWKRLGGGDDSPLATRELQLEEAKAALAAAEASLELARRNLERTIIRAPYDGRVRKKLVDLGQYVAPGTPVAGIYAIDYVEIRLPIRDSELAFLDFPPAASAKGKKTGPSVFLHADYAGKRHTWTGRIVRVEGEIDPLTRMVRVVAQVDEPYGRGASSDKTPLAVGLFVEAEIEGKVIDRAILVPRSAVRPDSTVLVVDSEDRIRFRKVDIFRMGEHDVVVSGGLRPGERVCVSSPEAPTDGMLVRVLNPVSKSRVSPDSTAETAINE